MLSAATHRKKNASKSKAKKLPLESSFQNLKPGYVPLIPREAEFEVSDLPRVKLTQTMDDNSVINRNCCVTEGNNLEELLYVFNKYSKCAAALTYDAADKFANVDCIVEGFGYDNYTTALLETRNATAGFDENNNDHWNLVIANLYTKYGVNADALRDFYDYIEGLKKPYKWTPTQFMNRTDALLRYYEQLGGTALTAAAKTAFKKKVLLSGVPNEMAQAWHDLNHSLSATPLEELIRFMNDQRNRVDAEDSVSSDDDNDNHPQKKRKTNNHVIIGSNDRCPHCNHNHTWGNCRRFNTQAPGYWGYNNNNPTGNGNANGHYNDRGRSNHYNDRGHSNHYSNHYPSSSNHNNNNGGYTRGSGYRGPPHQSNMYDGMFTLAESNNPPHINNLPQLGSHGWQGSHGWH